MSKQPDALRLADWCDANSSGVYRPSAEAAAELRRLHSLNAELVDALKRCHAELAGLPKSLGYEYTHLRDTGALIAKAEAQQ